ncbi:phage tail protein [Brucella tritici]|uniref:phage tail-collar fiber domain-containing protein n=1 Tax=Brucella tritici TaxID=94626 RepID=UPI003D6D4448
MAQNSFALMTNLGRAKEAAALANGTSIIITHIAIGDGATVPSGGETALYNEVARKEISGHGTVVGASNVAYFDIFLAASEGPYTIREAGLYDNAGDLIAIARYDPPINKPVPASGQTVEGTVRLEVAFSNVANVTIVVDPAFIIPLQRLSRLPWISVLSMSITAPPATPALGDAYLVPPGATGSWAGQSGKIAEYTAAGWGVIAPPDGHGISLPDGRCFEKVGGSYVEKIALDAQSGKWNYVVAAGTANAITAALTPAPSSYSNGMLVLLGVSANSTVVAPTLNLNGLGAKPIVNADGSALMVGALVAGAKQLLAYDSVLGKFILLTPANTGVKAGNNWIRHSDGTYEVWGQVSFSGTDSQIDVTLPITFPTSVDSILMTDTASGVFAGAASAISTSQIRCYCPRYYVYQGNGTIIAKSVLITLFYRVWGK